MKLTAEQEKAMQSLLWLIDPRNRAAGRTTALAYAFLMTAINTRSDIKVWDHHPTHEAKMNLVNEMARVSQWPQFKMFNMTWVVPTNSVRMIPK